MEEQLNTYITEIKNGLATFEAFLKPFGDEEINWKPGPERWSIAECIRHLCITGEMYIPYIESAIYCARQQNKTGQGPFRYGRLGNWFIRSLDIPVKRKFKAPELFTPTPGSEEDKRHLQGEYVILQEHYVGLIEQSDGLHLAKVKLRSPASALIRFSLGQAFELTTAHQRRHMWQAEQVFKHDAFPKKHKVASAK